MNAPAHIFDTPGRVRTTEAFARQAWDRGDGYDARDPDASPVWRCWGCDAVRAHEAGNTPCSDCEETSCYLDDGGIPVLAPITTTARRLDPAVWGYDVEAGL